ncbi:Glycine cleavage system H protein [Corynebacterium ciconiae DSM 44920]|uniref:glycine cleavage system protein GcvH n=1 Tax=Corynebacterium ciconiae TaxID=227319 RepID=UPI00036A23E4|nr:glycine cleavage system protein GcvH [Corynebacterium ciconiae]WKD60740.1 Glycine cleavage system H protein [Corynebacterium ciconiae DSM 44920]
MSQLPTTFSYSEDHEWIDCAADNAAGNTVKVGLTSIAADRLGEIVFVDLPAVGDSVEAGEICGEVESTKSVSDIYSPVTGTVTAINEELEDNPGLINDDPFASGFLFEVEVQEVGELMDAAEYEEQNS